VRDTSKRQSGGGKPRVRRPERFLAIRIVETGDCVPAAILGVARSGYIHGRDWDATREIWFYGPAAPAGTVESLEGFVAANTMPRGAGPAVDLEWRDETAVKVELRTLDEFLRKVFYPMAKRDKALVAGHDLLATFGAMAQRWGRSHRHDVAKRLEAGKPVSAFRRNQWSIELLIDDPDPKTGEVRPDARWHSRIIAIPYGDEAMAFRLGTLKRKGRQPRGEFLDLSQLGNALTRERRSFAEDLKLFGLPGSGEISPRGSPSGTGVAMRQAARAIVALAEAMVGYFDALHPGLSRANGGPLAETRAFGCGSIARALAAAAGLAPAPIVAPEMIGLCAEANHGAWCGIGIRGRVPVAETDFRRQYATIFVRQDINDLMRARRLEFIEATVESKALAETHSGRIGPDLNVFCLIHWRGEPAMVKAAFRKIEGREPDADDFTLAMAPRWSNGPVPGTLADAVAARIFGGRPPEIVKAWRIEAAEPRPLQKIDVLGRKLDPEITPIPLALVEEGERLRRGDGRFGAGWFKKASPELRDALAKGVKKIGNIFSYGMLIEAREADLPAGAAEKATLLHAGGAMRRKVLVPEDDGPLTCVSLGAIVTASGRLLLARLHRAVIDRGDVMACWDTDSGHIVATPEGGDLALPARGGGWYGAALRPQRVRALSWREVDEIAAEFDGEGLLPGSALRVTDENFDPKSGERVPLEGLYLGGKRYFLTAPGGRLASAMETLIGNPLPALREGFIAAAWGMLDAAWSGSPARRAEMRPEWLKLPVVCEMTVSLPDHAFALQGIDGNRRRVGPPVLDHVHPGMRYVVAQATGWRPGGEKGETRRVAAPFSDDPREWKRLPWRFVTPDMAEPRTEPFRPGLIDGKGFCWDFERWGGLMDHFLLMGTPAMLGPDGEPAGGWTRGLLRPRPMRDGRHYYLLKERFGWGAGPDDGFDRGLAEMFEGDPAAGAAEPEPADDDTWDAIRAALGIIGIPEMVRRGAARQTVQAWIAGERRPDDLMKVAPAVAAAACDLGLAVAGEPAPAEAGDLAICGSLPAMLKRAHRFNAMAAIVIGAEHGGRAGLARALGISKSAVDRALKTAREAACGEAPGKTAASLSSASTMTAFLARLGRHSRAEIRRRLINGAVAIGAKAKLPTFPDGPRGDRVAIVALLSLICSAPAPVIKRAEWCLCLPEMIAAVALPGAPEARPAELDAKPAGWLALMGEIARALGLATAARRPRDRGEVGLR
jgi:hypothetical protein